MESYVVVRGECGRWLGGMNELYTTYYIPTASNELLFSKFGDTDSVHNPSPPQ